MKLYAYCLAEGLETLPASLAGISGAKVRLLRVENLSLLVSDISEDSIPVTRDNALAHAAVVRSVLDQTTPLPFRFGTLVTEQVLTSYLTASGDALHARLAQVRDCVEMSVKIIWNDEGTGNSPANDHSPEKPGTAFLFEKKRELEGSEARAAEAKRVASWLEARVGELARETRVDTNVTGKLLVAAAHLVERASIERYRARLDDARQQRPELHFLISGPWPPYSFANIDLEFKAQFGVN